MLQQDGGGHAGGHSKSQLPEPGGYKYPSLSEKGPEAELFRSGLKSRWGRNKQGFCLAVRILPQNPTALAGIAKGGMETGGITLPAPRRDNSFAAKAPSSAHKTHPPTKGRSLSTTLYQSPESPHAGVGGS